MSAAPKADVARLRSMLRYLRPYRVRVALAFLAILFTSVAVLGMGASLHYMVDNGLRSNDEQLLNRSYALLLGVTMLLALATYARYFLVSWLGERVVADIRRDAHAKLISMHVGFFETNSTGDLLSRITTDTTLLQSVITSSLATAIRNSLLFIGGFTLLLLTSATLTGYVFLMLPLVVVPILMMGRRVRVLSRETQKKVAQLNAYAEETIGFMRTVQAMTMEGMETRRFRTLIDETLTTALGRIRLRAMLTAVVIALIFGAVVTVLWIGGHDVMNGRITPGALSAFVFYAVVVAGAVGAISEVVADLQRAAGAAERLEELFAWQPVIVTPANPAPLPDSSSSELRFEGVSFSYPSRMDARALSDISFTVKPGKTVAIVGPSGSGKTTIFQMILRFYDPESGRITFGGTDIRDFAPQDYRRTVGLVPQDPVIFSADALTNIRCGREDASEEEVVEAARAASAWEFIERLPQGLQTHLGEKGIQLSGGQRQRIAIARALVRSPGLLLLDEATSSLDAENERLVQQALKTLMQGRTTLAIAHRLATIIHADTILFMQHGVIEATGTHTELLETHAAYRRLAALQFNN
jgi:ATP-binding cassette subfamily B protein